MNLSEVRRSLASAERQGLAEARMTLDRLRSVAREPWLDHRARAAMLELARRCQELLEIPSSEPLKAGEAWLLLALGENRGRVVRMSALPNRTATATLPRTETFAALRGLGAAAVHAKRFVPSDLLETRFALADGEAHVDVTGSSLGLSACVALTSCLSKRPPLTNVAGTAAVCPDTGRLLPITALDAKCRALREEWPEIDALVVAVDQTGVPETLGLRIVRAPTVGDALSAFGLDLSDLPKPTMNELKERIGRLERQDGEQRELHQWSALAEEARELANLASGDKPALAAQAEVWAALFFSHAGNNAAADTTIKGIPEQVLVAPVHRVMAEVVRATVAIDEDAVGAEALARKAIDGARTLAQSEQQEWLGKALGTYGRALMHGGDPVRAEPLLREAHQHHLTHVKDEAPRSACYLACCLRLLGRLEEAMALVAAALESTVELEDRYESMRTTRAFLALEHGRVLAASGHVAEAIAVVETLVEPDGSPAKYPRLGAHRTLAGLMRRAGQLGAAHDHLLACWSVALDGSQGLTARKVGAVAAAEELLEARSEGRAPMLPPDALAAVWAKCFRAAPMERVVRLWIY